jgi:hypothetical protein
MCIVLCVLDMYDLHSTPRPHPLTLYPAKENRKLGIYTKSLYTIWSDKKQKQCISIQIMFGLWVKPSQNMETALSYLRRCFHVFLPKQNVPYYIHAK